MSIEARLSALGIELPPLAAPAAAYLPYVQTGSLVFLSGHIAKKDGKAWVGQLGATMGTEEGKAAARAIANKRTIAETFAPTPKTPSPTKIGHSANAVAAEPPNEAPTDANNGAVTIASAKTIARGARRIDPPGTSTPSASAFALP